LFKKDIKDVLRKHSFLSAARLIFMSLIAFISSSSIIAQVMLFAHLRFAKISGLISELGGALGLMKTMPEALGAESLRTTKKSCSVFT